MRVVLCDENRILSEALAAGLKARGHQVVGIATTASDGVRAVAAHQPDVCVLDPCFHESPDGLAAARSIRKHHPGTKVLVLSAVTEPATVARALDDDVAGFLRKDQDVGQIADALDVVAKGLHAAPMLAAPGSAPDGEHWASSWGAARDGARIVMTRVQACALVLLVALGAVFVGTAARSALIVCLGILTALYFATGVHKMWLLIRGELAGTGSVADSHREEADALPLYTVLVPLYREGRILPALVERLRRIDYPPDRLEVLLLIEEDDEQTRKAANGCPLPPGIRPMLMPAGQPRTKPRALNIALQAAQGEYIVVYDAEDQPEPDQLRKAVAALRALPLDVVCLQARLNFYNRHQSVLTRMFAVDYAVWYNQFLPGLTAGLARPNAFVPLGGTSNHFRVEPLRKLGGWDPFNVTEDCDLGVRLGRASLRVAMLDSTTWEEAVPRARPWVRQRSRWVKGYLQTYLVHMRRPVQLLRELGVRGFIDFQMLVGGTSLLLLVNPLMWALTVTYAESKGTHLGNFIQTLFPPVIYYPGLLSLIVWNFIFFYCNAYVCVRHDLIDLIRYTLLTPLYWALMSLGAWAGLISLIRNPSYWAKTEHGVSLSDAEASGAVPVGYLHTEPLAEEATT